MQLLLLPHCIADTPGAALESTLNIHPKDVFIRKGTNSRIECYSCFSDVLKTYSTNCHQVLQDRNVSELYICGVATDFSVKFTVFDALDLGYSVYVIENAIVGLNLEDSEKATTEMKLKGAVFVNSETVNNRPSLSNLPPLEPATPRARQNASPRSIYEENRVLERQLADLSAENARQTGSIAELNRAVGQLTAECADISKVKYAVSTTRDRLQSAQELNAQLQSDLSKPSGADFDLSAPSSLELECLRGLVARQESDIDERKRLIRTFKNRIHDVNRKLKRLLEKRKEQEDVNSGLLGRFDQPKSKQIEDDARQERNRVQIAEIAKSCDRDIDFIAAELARPRRDRGGARAAGGARDRRRGAPGRDCADGGARRGARGARDARPARPADARRRPRAAAREARRDARAHQAALPGDRAGADGHRGLRDAEELRADQPQRGEREDRGGRGSRHRRRFALREAADRAQQVRRGD
jgi:uncharacterized coiled-coil protein SlyX